MKRSPASSGNVGYTLLWILGVPLPMLIVMYLLSA